MRSRSCIAVLVLAGLIGPAFGQDIDLKWKFEKGKTFYQDLNTVTDQNMTVMGMKISQKQDQTFFFSWTPVEEKDKVWTIKQRIEGVKMSINIGGNPVTFDSTKDTTTSNPLNDFFKALVGSDFTLTVPTADMKVTKVEGQKEFLDKLVKANQQMKPLLETILSEDALRQMADPAFGMLPNKPVKKGDTWSRDTTLSLGPIGTYKSTYKYTAEGAVDDKDNKHLQKIKVETTLKYDPPAEGAASTLPFKIKKANLTSKDATGTIIFDTTKGRVASMDLTMKLQGTLDIEIGGQTTPVELDQTQTTKMKTSDDNPLPKKA